MLHYLLKIHNFITAPFSQFFIERYNCPLSVKIAPYFYDYFYIWFLILFLSCSLTYFVFKKCIQLLLRRMGLTTQRARHASSALWAAGTGLGATLLSASQLQVSPWDLTEVPPPEDNPPAPHHAIYFTILAACQCQGIAAGCLRRGFTRHTVADIFHLSILPAAYIARWTDVGFTVSLLLSEVRLVSELSRLGLSFRKGRHSGTFTFFILYCFVWCLVYFIALPACVVLVATTPMTSQQHQIGLALLFVSITGHILASCMFSPLVPALRGYLRGVPAAEWLQSALFPGTDQTMLQVRKLAKQNRDNMEANSLSRKNSMKVSEEKPEQPQQQQHQHTADAKALIQTVRCVTVLKRKIKAMRKKKADEMKEKLD